MFELSSFHLEEIAGALADQTDYEHPWLVNPDTGQIVSRSNRNKFGGVRNGVDYDIWNPETDRLLPANYSPADIAGKYASKHTLREWLWLRQDFRPIVAYIGRLDRQKGVHLIRHAMWSALASGAQFVLLGTGADPAVNEQFWHLKNMVNDNPHCHLELGYSQELAHLVYAGADILVVPSLFEPCGLSQLTAMRYGTVPVVRHIGGLVDTVHDRDHSDRPVDQRNGYVFHQCDEHALDSALHRAVGLWWGYPAEFRTLMRTGMRQDYSWARPGEDYVRIYDYIRHR